MQDGKRREERRRDRAEQRSNPYPSVLSPPRCVRGVDDDTHTRAALPLTPTVNAGAVRGSTGGPWTRRRRWRVVMPRGTQVSSPFASGILAFSERIWSAPSMQVPPYPTSHCSSKFLAGDFVFTETSLSSPLSIAPEDHASFCDYLAWSHAVGH